MLADETAGSLMASVSAFRSSAGRAVRSVLIGQWWFRRGSVLRLSKRLMWFRLHVLWGVCWWLPSKFLER